MNAISDADLRPAEHLSRLAVTSADAELIALCDRHIANHHAYNNSDPKLNSDDNPLWPVYEATRDALDEAKPMTLAGLVAKARAAKVEAWSPTGHENYAGGRPREWSWDLVNDLLRIGCDSVALALSTLTSPDAELIAICNEIAALEHHMWQVMPPQFEGREKEMDAAHEPFREKQYKLLGRAVEMRAGSLDGFRAKARALRAWASDYACGVGYDDLLISSLLDDLLAGEVA
jgi:hypothetical protein